MKNGARIVAGVDVGGTKTAVAVADENGRMLARFQTKTDDNPAVTVNWIYSVLTDWGSESGLGFSRISAVGAGCPGPLDYENGVILKAPNLKQWSGYPLRYKLSEILNLPVYLENDADLGAIGEHRYGAGQGFRDVVYMTVSTGIGGGLIVQNQLLRGVGNSAGEIGHMTIDPHGPICGCGNLGCLEALASGTAIVRVAQEKMKEGWQPNFEGMGDSVTAKSIAAMAEKGDCIAEKIIHQAMTYLGIGVANVITILSPEAVIIGGGIANLGQRMFEPVQKEVSMRVKLVPFEKISIRSAMHLDDAVLFGGIYLALHENMHQNSRKE